MWRRCTPLLQKQLKKSILFGATFPTVAPAFSAAADAMRKIAVAAPHLKTPHMVTAAGGATFNQKQLSPSLHGMTFPLANDKNSVTHLIPDPLSVPTNRGGRITCKKRKPFPATPAEGR